MGCTTLMFECLGGFSSVVKKVRDNMRLSRILSPVPIENGIRYGQTLKRRSSKVELRALALLQHKSLSRRPIEMRLGQARACMYRVLWSTSDRA